MLNSVAFSYIHTVDIWTLKGLGILGLKYSVLKPKIRGSFLVFLPKVRPRNYVQHYDQFQFLFKRPN